MNVVSLWWDTLGICKERCEGSRLKCVLPCEKILKTTKVYKGFAIMSHKRVEILRILWNLVMYWLLYCGLWVGIEECVKEIIFWFLFLLHLLGNIKNYT